MKIRDLRLGILWISLSLCTIRPTDGFTGILSQQRRVSRTLPERFPISTALSSGVEPVVPEGVTIEDRNGKFITVGSIVRVTASNLKAYQVPADGYGVFNEEKEFIPTLGDVVPRALQNLMIPVGMRGVVTKIIDKSNKKLSANLPIQVKFSPGEHIEEGYNPPIPFVMHFSVREIESL